MEKSYKVPPEKEQEFSEYLHKNGFKFKEVYKLSEGVPKLGSCLAKCQKSCGEKLQE